MAPRRDELFVSTGSGLLQRVNWHGLLEGEMTMSIHSIPFTNDLENARGLSPSYFYDPLQERYHWKILTETFDDSQMILT